MVPPSVLLADEHRKNRHLAALFIRTSKSRRGTCWSLEVVSSALSVSPDGALFDEAGENTEIIGGGDQSDCEACWQGHIHTLRWWSVWSSEASQGSQVTIALTGTTGTT